MQPGRSTLSSSNMMSFALYHRSHTGQRTATLVIGGSPNSTRYSKTSFIYHSPPIHYLSTDQAHVPRPARNLTLTHHRILPSQLLSSFASTPRKRLRLHLRYMYMRARERISNLNFAPKVSMSNFGASFIWFALVSLFGLSKGSFICKLRPLR